MTTKTNYKVDGYSITEEVRVITPAEASEILAKHNTKNRKPNKRHINALALNMQNGTWRFNGDAIRFDCNGTLIDGQNRLFAVAKSGKPVLFKIVRGLDPKAILTIDIESKPRNLADLLHMDGIKDSRGVASIIVRYFALHEGRTILNGGAVKNGTSANRDLSGIYTNDDKYNFYYQNKDAFDEFACYAQKLYKRNKLLTQSDIGGIFAHLYIDKHHSEDEIKGFFEELFTSSEKSCINSLRNRLIADLVATTRMTGSFRQSLIAKVWNYYIKGKDVKVLSYNPTTEGTIEFI